MFAYNHLARIDPFKIASYGSKIGWEVIPLIDGLDLFPPSGGSSSQLVIHMLGLSFLRHVHIVKEAVDTVLPIQIVFNAQVSNEAW